MTPFPRHLRRRAPLRHVMRRAVSGALVAGVLLPLAGCRSYAPAPLDLDAHHAATRDRLADPAPLAAFARRVAAAGAPAPERFDPSDGLSLAEAEVLALFANPGLQTARRHVDVQRATAQLAGQWADPVFGFDAAEILAGGFESGAMLELTLPISGAAVIERDVARSETGVAILELAAAEWAVRADVRRAWIRWTTATEHAAVLDAVAKRVAGITDLAASLAAAGELSRVESRLFQLERAGRTAELIAAEGDAATARLAVLALVGLAPDAAVELVPALGMPMLSAVVEEDFTASTNASLDAERLITRHPGLAVRRAAYEVAEHELRLAIRRQYPDLTIGGGFGREDGENRVLFGLSLPIPLTGTADARIDAAAARRDEAAAAAMAAFDRLRASLAVADAQRRSARSQRERYERDIVPMLAEQTADIDRIAALGDLDTLLLLEAVSRRYDASVRLLELRREELIAAATVIELRGPHTPLLPAPVPAPVPTEGTNR